MRLIHTFWFLFNIIGALFQGVEHFFKDININLKNIKKLQLLKIITNQFFLHFMFKNGLYKLKEENEKQK